MKKGVLIVLLLGILFVLPLVLAQEQTQTYSDFNRFVDNVKFVFLGEDKDVILALEIREKEVNSAINNLQNQGEDKAMQNLERAKEKLQLVQEKVSLDTSEEIKTSVDEVVNRIKEEENLSEEFEDYLLEEEKTQLTAELIEKIFEYCTELAKEDFSLVLKEEECNPETSMPGIEKELEKLKDLQLKMFVKLMLEIRSCVDDPGTCNCEANVDVEQKAKCEKMVTLANKCENEEDEISCNELESIKPRQGDGFAESFVPDYLMNLFKEKSYMIEYDIEPSDGVPEECWDENDKPECKQYEHLKETNDDWDEYGNFIGKRPENKEPTMQESIPQCFDKNNTFLEEKCGKITVTKNKEGLVNYIIENEINGTSGGFENKSARNTIDINKSDGQMQVQNKSWEIKKEMNQINNQIKNITYAPGTGPGGDTTNDVKNVVVEGGKDGEGTGGLTPEVKIDIVEEGNNGNNVVDNGVDDGPGEPGVVDED